LKRKNILVIYHSQGGTMKTMASRFALGAAKEQEINVVLKKAGDANKLTCLIARQSPSALLNISALWLA